VSDDPRSIWQNQQREEMEMSVAEFLQRAARHRAKTRGTVLFNDAVYAIVIVFLASKLSYAPDNTTRLGLVLLALGCAYSLYRRHRLLWPRAQTSDAQPASGLETYRQELLRWRDDSRETWRMLAPLVPGCIVLAARFATRFIQIVRQPGAMANSIPFFILLGVWFLLIFPVRLRRIRSIEREIDAVQGLLENR
jgi:hypothetical protein